MPTLELVRGKQKSITEEEADRVTEILTSNNKPEFVKIQGKPIRVSKIVDIDDSDVEYHEQKKEQMKEQNEMYKQIQQEREDFIAKGSEEKTKFWFYNVFMTKYLTMEGFRKVLGVALDRNFPDWKERWNEKFDEYLNQKTRAKIIQAAMDWYEENKQSVFPPPELYAQWLPSYETEVEGFKKVGQ